MFGVGGCKDGEGEGRERGSGDSSRKGKREGGQSLYYCTFLFFPHTDRSIRPVLWVRGTFMAMTTLHSVLVGYMVQCVCQQ